jgi:SAM-dependent methyltransferase
MTKISSPPNANAHGWRKVGTWLVSRTAVYFYIIGIGFGGAAAFSVFVEAERWVAAVIGVLISLFFFQLDQVFYLRNQIQDMHPQSAPIRKIIEEQRQSFETVAQGALDGIEDRLLTVVKALPDLFSLATHPVFQQYLLRIGHTVRTTPRHATGVMDRIVSISLEETASDVDAVANNKLVIKNEPEIADPRWKALLEPAAVGRYAVATSWVLPKWWRLNRRWKTENAAAVEKGLRLARIFIVENDQELQENGEAMREQAQSGIQVNWVYASTLRENGLDPRDILVSDCLIQDFDNPDNSQKHLLEGSIFGEQVLETGLEENGSKKAGYRMVARRVELSAYPPEVRTARNTIERIYQLSQRFDDPLWWSYFFDNDYVPITKYKESTAEAETEMLIKNTNLRSGARILDLGCAYGRIERIIEEKLGSVDLTPIECSQKLLDEAVSSAIQAFTRRGMVPHDMREIDELHKAEFDLAMSMFTSWGYFREDDNQNMFRKVYAVLKEGGLFYLDIDNPSFIREKNTLQQYESNGNTILRWDAVKGSKELNSDGKQVAVTRRLSQFSVVRPSGSTKSKPLVSLRLYELNELQTIAAEIGFEFVQAWDESGQDWKTARLLHPRHIPERLIVLLRK